MLQYNVSYTMHVRLRTKTFTGARACWLMTASFTVLLLRYNISYTRRRPNDVVAGHKRKAVALWMLLIFAILACEHFFSFGTAVHAWHIFRCCLFHLLTLSSYSVSIFLLQNRWCQAADSHISCIATLTPTPLYASVCVAVSTSAKQ